MMMMDDDVRRFWLGGRAKVEPFTTAEGAPWPPFLSRKGQNGSATSRSHGAKHEIGLCQSLKCPRSVAGSFCACLGSIYRYRFDVGHDLRGTPMPSSTF